MNPLDFIYILIIHTIGDYLLQNRKTAINKSSDNIILIDHVSFYTITWFCFLVGYGSICINTKYDILPYILSVLYFCIINGLLHFVTDYFTSRKIKKMFQNEEYYTELPNLGVFTIMKFDQILHYIPLIITYYYLIKPFLL